MTKTSSVDWSSLPAPEDDGATDHLAGREMPAIALASTDGRMVDLSVARGISVIYIYPKTGEPGANVPDRWNAIPGARGCSPQACAFRDHFDELRGEGVQHLFGLSAQTTAAQAKAVAQFQLPFPLLSDAKLKFAEALTLPTFDYDGETLIKRLTLIVKKGKIERVFYPVFPPDQNAADVVAWLRETRLG